MTQSYDYKLLQFFFLRNNISIFCRYFSLLTTIPFELCQNNNLSARCNNQSRKEKKMWNTQKLQRRGININEAQHIRRIEKSVLAPKFNKVIKLHYHKLEKMRSIWSICFIFLFPYTPTRSMYILCSSHRLSVASFLSHFNFQ